MNDGISMSNKKLPYPSWREMVPVQFTSIVDVETGEIVPSANHENTKTYVHTGYFQSYKLTVKETHHANGDSVVITYILFIRGSLHCNYYGGKNVERFTIQDLQNEIASLCCALCLDPKDCEIQNLEIGVNIRMPFAVDPFISSSILLHSTTKFEGYTPDKQGKVIGKVAVMSQRTVKCYSKSLQHNLDYPLMRFEVRCTKMQYLKQYNIKTLADLTDVAKLGSLSAVVLAAWDKVLVCDPTIKAQDLQLISTHRDLLIQGCNVRFWTELHQRNKRAFNKRRTLFGKLTAKHGIDYRSLVKGLIEQELIAIFDDSVVEASPSNNISKEIGNVFTIKIKSNSIPNEINRLSPIRPIKPIKPIRSVRCLSAFNLSDSSDRSDDQPIKQTSSSAPDCLPMVTSVVPVKAISDSSTYTNQGCQEQKATAANYEEQLTRYSVKDYCCSTDRLVIPVDWLNSRFLRRQ